MHRVAHSAGKGPKGKTRYCIDTKRDGVSSSGRRRQRVLTNGMLVPSESVKRTRQPDGFHSISFWKLCNLILVDVLETQLCYALLSISTLANKHFPF